MASLSLTSRLDGSASRREMRRAGFMLNPPSTRSDSILTPPQEPSKTQRKLLARKNAPAESPIIVPAFRLHERYGWIQKMLLSWIAVNYNRGWNERDHEGNHSGGRIGQQTQRRD